MIVTAVMTCGRKDYLERTLASYDQHVAGDLITREVFFDDSGDREFRAWLTDMADQRGGSVVWWGPNQGYTTAMRLAWRWLWRHTIEPHVFHLEEDFTFDRDVPVADMVTLVDEVPELAQVVLLRAAAYRREIAAGGIIEQNPAAYTQRVHDGIEFVEHSEFFSANPCLYRRVLLAKDWPNKRNSEAVLGHRIVAEGQRFAFLGDGTPWITHIGEQRGGSGY